MFELVYKIFVDWLFSIFWNIFSEVVICIKIEILVFFVVIILVLKIVIEFLFSGLFYNVRLFYNFL